MQANKYLFVVFLLVASLTAFSQEIPYNINSVLIGDATPPTCDGVSGGVVPLSNGEHLTVSVIQGNEYTFDFCNDLFDSQMDIWSVGGSIFYTGNDDDCGPRGFQSRMVWTATITGVVEVHISEWFCLVDRHWAQQPLTVTCTGTTAPCPANITLTGSGGGTADYETDGFIESSQTVITGSMIDYDSGTAIDLMPDFEVQLGAIFCAFIDGCNGGLGGGVTFTSEEETVAKKAVTKKELNNDLENQNK